MWKTYIHMSSVLYKLIYVVHMYIYIDTHVQSSFYNLQFFILYIYIYIYICMYIYTYTYTYTTSYAFLLYTSRKMWKSTEVEKIIQYIIYDLITISPRDFTYNLHAVFVYDDVDNDSFSSAKIIYSLENIA